MSEVKVLGTERVGELVAVTVEVESDEIFSVNGLRLDAPSRDDAFHQRLHDERITHAHNRRTVRETLYLPHPLDDTLLEQKIAALHADLSVTEPGAFDNSPPALQERCVVNGTAQREFYRADACPQAILDALLASFPGLDLTPYSLISSPSYNEVIGQDVISTFLWEDDVAAPTVNGVPVITRSRKFCLGAGKWYDRLYLLADASDSTALLPPSCVLLAKSVNANAQAGLELPDFYDLYFRGDDAEIQQAFNLPATLGSSSTYYGLTVLAGKVVRAKQYCYDTPGAFSDWDGTVNRARVAHGVDEIK